jgi:hypothetical protein
MLDLLALRLLERTAENLQLVQSVADVRRVGEKLQEDISYLRSRHQPFGPSTTSEPPVDVDQKT